MTWTVSRDITTEQNYKNTNILIAPLGMGVPVSSAELNSNFLISTKKLQEIYSDFTPSGFISKILPISSLETTATQDLPGELCSILNNGIPLSSTIRLGESVVNVNGWNISVTNNVGTNGIHNNIVLDIAPTSGNRFDLVFLEVFLAELGGTSATISNTANKPSATSIYLYGNTQYNGINATDDISEIDAEINRRWQIQYRIRIVDNVDLNTYVDGVNHSTAVKAWGANPNNTWSGFTAGIGSAYTFVNNYNNNGDNGLFIAGDGSTTAKSILGTVDGFVYAIPIAGIFRRNSGIYDPNINPYGCAQGSSDGNIASGISGRPDGLYYDQIDASDITSLRHQCLIDTSINLESIASKNFEKIVRGKSNSNFGIGDGLGSPTSYRSTFPTYSQEICPIASVDAGFRGLAQYDYQRRMFSDAAQLQQTEFKFTGGVTPDNSRPSILTPPIAGTASTSTVSGTLASGNYSFKITYTNSYGETTPSPESTAYTLTANGTLTVNSPIVEGNASGWNLYVTSTPGSGWTKQNSSPIAIGTNYVITAPLSGTTIPPTTNTTSSTLVITADSSGLANGTSTILCIDGTSTPSAGNLQGGNNILVYDAVNFTPVLGTWSGLNTASATFTPTGGWGGTTTTNGVVAIVAIHYPAGNGLPIRPSSMLTQNLSQGSNLFSMSTFGVSGVSSADNTHLNSPSGVFIDGTGNIFVADTNNHRIIKLNNSMVFQAQFGVTGIYGTDNVHLNSPSSVVVDTSGNIYITDTNNHRVVKLNSSLAYVTQFGTTAVSGSDIAHLNTPQQLTIDSTQSNLYIADSLNNRIVRLTLALAYGSTSLTGLASVQGVAIDTLSNLYVTYGQYVSKYNSTGTLISTFGNGAVGSNNFSVNNPNSIVLDQNSYVLFCDTNNHRIVKLNTNFIYVGQMGITSNYSTDAGRFNAPKGLAVDTNNQIFTADTLNHRLIKLHEEMGGFDPSTRTFSVMLSGAPSDKLKFSYRYRPYSGIIGKQGNNQFSYTLKAITNIKPFVTSCGTGGKNINIEDELNGLTVRLPFPATYFGNSSPVNDGEYVQVGGNFTGGIIDPSPIVTNLPVSWGGSSSTFYAAGPNGGQSPDIIAGSKIIISQNTSISVLPTRGVNSIEKYNDVTYPYNNGYDYIGFSFGSFSNSSDHITYGYFLAVASGGTSVLPVLEGEVVLVIVGFRVNGTAAAIYGQPSIASAIDVFKLEERPVVYF